MRRTLVPTAILLVLASGLTLFVGAAAAQDEKLPTILASEPLPAKGTDDELGRLLKERYNAAREQALGRYKEWLVGNPTTELLIQAVTSLRDAGLEVK